MVLEASEAQEQPTKGHKRGRKPITNPDHLSPSERVLLVYIVQHQGESGNAEFSKR